MFQRALNAAENAVNAAGNLAFDPYAKARFDAEKPTNSTNEFVKKHNKEVVAENYNHQAVKLVTQAVTDMPNVLVNIIRDYAPPPPAKELYSPRPVPVASCADQMHAYATCSCSFCCMPVEKMFPSLNSSGGACLFFTRVILSCLMGIVMCPIASLSGACGAAAGAISNVRDRRAAFFQYKNDLLDFESISKSEPQAMEAMIKKYS